MFNSYYNEKEFKEFKEFKQLLHFSNKEYNGGRKKV